MSWHIVVAEVYARTFKRVHRDIEALFDLCQRVVWTGVGYSWEIFYCYRNKGKTLVFLKYNSYHRCTHRRPDTRNAQCKPWHATGVDCRVLVVF
jgi:hypothetical protein